MNTIALFGIVDGSYFSASAETCPYCLRRFALRLVEVEFDPVFGECRSLECNSCRK